MSVKLNSALVPPNMTSTQRDAIPSGRRPPGSVVFNTTTNQLEINTGSDATPAWTSTNSWHVGTTPPSTPSTGDTWVYQGSGFYWLFVYDSTEATYKWKFVGGPPLTAQVSTLETTASTTYVALTTAGPNITLPRAGDYIVEQSAMAEGNGAAGTSFRMSYDIGATGAVDGDSAWAQSSGVNALYASLYRKQLKTGLSAVTLTSKYKVSANSSDWANRQMSVTPVRVI